MSAIVTPTRKGSDEMDLLKPLQLFRNFRLADSRYSSQFSGGELRLGQPRYANPNAHRVVAAAQDPRVIVHVHGFHSECLMRNTHEALTPLTYCERVSKGYRTYVRPTQGEGLSPEGRPVAWSPGRDYDLFAGGAELLDLGVLSARSSAAAERVKAGQELDELDRVSLTELADLFESAAQTVEFFGTNGKGGSLPTGALAAQLDVAIDTVAIEMGDVNDATVLVTDLRKLADDARVFASEKTPSDPDRPITFFRGLSSSILRETGRIGERTSTL